MRFTRQPKAINNNPLHPLAADLSVESPAAAVQRVVVALQERVQGPARCAAHAGHSASPRAATGKLHGRRLAAGVDTAGAQLAVVAPP